MSVCGSGGGVGGGAGGGNGEQHEEARRGSKMRKKATGEAGSEKTARKKPKISIAALRALFVGGRGNSGKGAHPGKIGDGRQQMGTVNRGGGTDGQP